MKAIETTDHLSETKVISFQLVLSLRGVTRNEAKQSDLRNE